MPVLTAPSIHNGRHWLPQGSAIEIADDGTIIAILSEIPDGAILYNGILAPGFVNVHCHLELSHMKGIVPEHTGLIPFLKTIPRHRNDHTDEQKRMARHNAYHELWHNGTVAIGDISNTIDTLDLRALGKMHYHTFIESIGFIEANAPRSFGFAKQAYDTFAAQSADEVQLRQTIIPHAPYSVSSALFRLIDSHQPQSVISIHNQESQEENKYYLSKEGDVQDLLHTLGIDDSLFTPSGRTSLQSYLEWLSPAHPFIFVHNTYTKEQDVRYAHHYLHEAYWCLCPNANLYIENTLPDIDMFIREGARICLGTDSLASNHELSILSEMRVIKKHFPQITWDTLLTWATCNGAQALQMLETIGTIEPGKKPGIVQLTELDSNNIGLKRII